MSDLDLSALGLRSAAPAGSVPQEKQTLGQDDFLTLLVTQLQNQDPLNPMQNEQFVAQLAQFSTVSGVSHMADTLDRLESIAGGGARSAAPGWIGRYVEGDGLIGQVQAVHFADDGSPELLLDSGDTLPLSSVTNLA